MKLGSFASMGGEYFCKPCFKKNFFTKGNYSDGFGKLTPQQEHDMKAGKDPADRVAYNTISFKGVNASNTSPRSSGSVIRSEGEENKKENDEKESRRKELSSVEEARKK